MDNFLVCISAVFPIVLITALGYLAKTLGTVSRDQVVVMNKAMFKTFMPILLFYNIYTSDLSASINPPIILFAIFGVLLAVFISFWYIIVTEKNRQMKGVMIQGIYRSNFVLFGLPLAQALSGGGDLGAVSILIAVVVPMYNVISVVVLGAFGQKKVSIRTLLSTVATNPLILGSAAGILALYAKIRLPDILMTCIRDISAATTPVITFLLGAFFEFRGLKKYSRELAKVCIGRLVVVPGIILTLGTLAGFRGVEFVALLGIFGSATAVASFPMAQQMGGDLELAGDIVVITSALCAFTLFGWAYLFKSLGAF